MTQTSLADLIMRSQATQDPAALMRFLTEVRARQPSATPRVLDAGCGAGVDLRWFHANDLRVDGIDLRPDALEVAARAGASVFQKDLRLAHFERAAYDGVWLNQVAQELTPDELHRVLQSLFLALKPGTGLLFISFPDSFMTSAQMGALLQQTGFQRDSEGERTLPNGDRWHAYFALRGGAT